MNTIRGIIQTNNFGIFLGFQFRRQLCRLKKLIRYFVIIRAFMRKEDEEVFKTSIKSPFRKCISALLESSMRALIRKFIGAAIRRIKKYSKRLLNLLPRDVFLLH